MSQVHEVIGCDLSAAPTPRLRAAHRVLMQAHELLKEPETWNQLCLALDADGNGTPSTSISRAIVTAGEKERVDSDTYELAREALSQNLPDGHRSLYRWKNAPERTYADVRRILREGAQTLQSHIDARPA